MEDKEVEALKSILEEMSIDAILQIGGVYEILKEEFYNDIIDKLDENN